MPITKAAGPQKGEPATPTTSVLCPKDTKNRPDFDFDRGVVHEVDESIWQALCAGQFRLAVPCDVCGRWLTDERSKRAHRGPRCAAKVVA